MQALNEHADGLNTESEIVVRWERRSRKRREDQCRILIFFLIMTLTASKYVGGQ